MKLWAPFGVTPTLAYISKKIYKLKLHYGANLLTKDALLLWYAAIATQLFQQEWFSLQVLRITKMIFPASQGHSL